MSRVSEVAIRSISFAKNSQLYEDLLAIAKRMYGNNFSACVVDLLNQIITLDRDPECADIIDSQIKAGYRFSAISPAETPYAYGLTAAVKRTGALEQVIEKLEAELRARGGETTP